MISAGILYMEARLSSSAKGNGGHIFAECITVFSELRILLMSAVALVKYMPVD